MKVNISTLKILDFRRSRYTLNRATDHTRQHGKFRALSAASFPFCRNRERVLINMSPVILVHFGTVHFGW